jgi:uncharacterized protein YdaU (DUF1376 family)
MAKDPAFLFYPGDWLGGTLGMTFEEKGAYMEILMLQFNRGHMTTHMIGHVIGHHWDKIKVKFKQDENGLWYNERLEQEQEKRKKFVKSRKNNIKGENQHTKNKINNGHKTTHMNGHMTSHMENENEDVIEDNIIGVGQNYFLIDKKYASDRLTKVCGKDGLIKYYELNKSVVNRPEYADKFMRDRNGKKFKDFSHLWNDYNQFVDKQYTK